MPGTGLFPVTLASEPLGPSHPVRPEPSFPTPSFSSSVTNIVDIRKSSNHSPHNALQMLYYHTTRVADVAVHPR
jgi:hypothetical protein